MYKQNTIYHEDCFEAIKKIPNDYVDVSFTSPPYNRIRNDTYQLFDDAQEDAYYLKFLTDITDEMLRVSKKLVIVNLQMNHFNKYPYCKFIGNYADKIKGMVVWEKTNPQPASNPKDNTYSVTNAYEMFFVLGKDNKEFRANHKIKNIISTTINSEHVEGHGAIMKREVAEWFIRNFTNLNDLVLDPFMGTGTTAVACYLHDRRWIGFELVKEYYDMCQLRLDEVYCEKNQLRMDI